MQQAKSFVPEVPCVYYYYIKRYMYETLLCTYTGNTMIRNMTKIVMQIVIEIAGI